MSGHWPNTSIRLLFTWARWRLLKHPSIWMVNRTLPVCGFLACAGALLLVPSFNITKEYGLIQQANGLLQILAPFFVAALALVAGFPGEVLDRPMGGMRPYLCVAGERHFPTRRELLGFLFAYLAGLSVLTYLGGGLVVAASIPQPQPVLRWLGAALHGYLGICLKAVYGAVLVHLFATTLLGLHFLGNFLTSSHLSRDSRPAPGGPSQPTPRPSDTAAMQGGPSEEPERRMRRTG